MERDVMKEAPVSAFEFGTESDVIPIVPLASAPPSRSRVQTVASVVPVKAPSSEIRLYVFQGAGGAGKSTVARLWTEWADEANKPPLLADGDRSHSTLAQFFPHALVPKGDDDEAMGEWFKHVTLGAARHKKSLILDVGGGDPVFWQLSRAAKVVPVLERHGVMPVLVHVLGPRLDDLVPLSRIEMEDVFPAAHKLIILNDGVRKPGESFRVLRAQPTYRALLDSGAVEIVLPSITVVIYV
jgi:hypothetical protein